MERPIPLDAPTTTALTDAPLLRLTQMLEHDDGSTAQETSFDDVRGGVDRPGRSLAHTEGIDQREQHDRVGVGITEVARLEEVHHAPATPVQGGGRVGEQ